MDSGAKAAERAASSEEQQALKWSPRMDSGEKAPRLEVMTTGFLRCGGRRDVVNSRAHLFWEHSFAAVLREVWKHHVR